MTLRDLALGASVFLTVALLATDAAAQAPRGDASAAWSDMAKCGALANDAARHSCMDEVLRRNGAMAPPEARSAERRRLFGLEVPSFPHREPVRAEARAQTPTPPARASEEADDRITVTLEAVSLRGDGRLAVKTSEGAVWRQVEADPIRPTPISGQSMTIERTLMGGYMCKPGRWVAFRCTREP